MTVAVTTIVYLLNRFVRLAPYMSQTQRLKRVFDIDIQTCLP
jgi:hypothetical protein